MRAVQQTELSILLHTPMHLADDINERIHRHLTTLLVKAHKEQVVVVVNTSYM